MNNQKLLKKYAKNFTEAISKNIKYGYVLEAKIHPVDSSGAIIEFDIVNGKKSKTLFEKPAATVGKSLQSIQQNFIGGNLDGVTFSGTNVMMDNNRIIIVKGENDNSVWNLKAAREDALRVISPKDRSVHAN